MNENQEIQAIRKGLKFISILLVFCFLTHIPGVLDVFYHAKQLSRDMGSSGPPLPIVKFLEGIFNSLFTYIFVLVGFVVYVYATVRAKGVSFLYSTGIILACFIWVSDLTVSVSQELIRNSMEGLIK